MALLVGELFARVTAEDREYQQVMRRVDATGEQTAGRVTMATKRMGAAMVATFSAGAIFVGIARIIKSASDLSESANGVSVTFGRAQHDIIRFAKDAADSIGQSEVQARQAATTFGIYGKQAGLAGAQLSGFSIEMSKLASDMASFRNTSVDEAIEALGAAFRGESDPIEKYGVLLNETVLQQRALKMGVIETTSQALTPQQRVMVAYAEIMEQTKDAQGDFGRTSGELANQLRTLQARAENTAAEIGQNLLPYAKTAVTWLAGPGIEGVKSFASGVGSAAQPVIALARAFGDLPGPVQAAIGAFVAWRLIGTQTTGAVGSAVDAVRDRMMLASTGIGVAALNIQQAYTDGANKTRAWAQEQHALAAASNPVMSTLRGAAGEAQGFISAMGGATSAVGVGLRGALSSLTAFLGGPWGITLMAGAALLGVWASESQAAARRQQELASAGRTVAEAIKASNGAINDNVRQKTAAVAEDRGLLRAAKDLGIALPYVTNAILGQGKAYDEIKSSIESVISRNRKWVGDNAAAAQANVGNARAETEARLKQIQSAEQFMKTIDGVRASTDDSVAADQRKIEATFDSAAAMDAMRQGSLSPMEEAIKGFADGTKSAEDRVKGLTDAILGLSGQQLPLDDALQNLNDTMRDMAKEMGEARTAASSAGLDFLNAAGGINTATEAGSKLHSRLSDLRQAQADVVAATMATADANGKITPEAAAKASLALMDIQNKLKDAARDANLNTEQVRTLTEHYLGLPADVVTQIQQPGMLEAIINSVGLKGKIVDIPNSKQVVLSSSAPEQIALMQALGFNVRTLPNGHILIESNTGPALEGARRIVTTINGMVATIRVNAAGEHFVQGSGNIKWNAHGQIMQYYAQGGLRPMSANAAGIVQSYNRTGVARVIGDNPIADELFLPLIKSSSRSQALLDEAIQRMRPELLAGQAAPVVAVGGPQTVDNRQFHFHEIKSMPSKEWVRNTMEDIERGI